MAEEEVLTAEQQLARQQRDEAMQRAKAMPGGEEEANRIALYLQGAFQRQGIETIQKILSQSGIDVAQLAGQIKPEGALQSLSEADSIIKTAQQRQAVPPPPATSLQGPSVLPANDVYRALSSPGAGSPYQPQRQNMMPSVMDVSRQTGLPAWLLHVPGGQQMAQGILGNQQQMSQMAARQHSADLQTAQFNREGIVAGHEFLQSLTKMPPKWRSLYIDKTAKTLFELTGQPVDPDFVKTLKSLNDEEWKQQVELWGVLRRIDPSLSMEEVLAMQANPEAAIQMWNVARQQQEVQQQKAERDIARKALELGNQAQGGGGAGVTPPAEWPQKSSNLAPEGSLKHQMQAMTVAEARRQGIPDAAALALVELESGFNPNATSPKGARGLSQVMPETGRLLGVSNPDELYSPETNLRAGLRYFGEQLRATNGNFYEAYRRYNGGPGVASGIAHAEAGDFMRRMAVYTGGFRATPVQYTGGMRGPQVRTQSDVPNALRDSPQHLQQEIADKERQMQILSKPELLGNKYIDPRRKELQGQLDTLYKRREDTLKRLDTQSTPEMDRFASRFGYPNWNAVPISERGQMEQAFQAEQLLRKEEEETQKQRIQRRESLVQKPQDIGKGLPAGTTVGEVERLPEGERRVRRELSDRQQKFFDDTDAIYAQLTSLEPRLHDKKIQKFLGGILANPTRWLTVDYVRRTTGLPEETVTAVADMAAIAAEFRHTYAGVSQSWQELAILKPFLPEENDPPDQAIAKTRAFITRLAEKANLHRDRLGKLDYLIPGEKLEPKPWAVKTDGEKPQGTTPMPAPAQPTPAQAAPAAPAQPEQKPKESEGFMRRWWKGKQ